ncbi:MAG: phage replisome organizer N-terminal domain-containing protein, partial [Flavobacterium sp.]|uniref:phage replisome organizer N-terminal domain-containing protein n=1 Tax=Flavobacterium sp. TaxID=239 RepID=UPI0032677D1B
ETLSMELNIPKPTVELGIVLFKKYKMIDIFRNKTIYLKNFEKHQNLEKINSQKEKNRIKVATHRKKVKQMIGKSVTVTEPLQLGYVTDKTKKTDLDSEKDTDTEFWGSGFLNSTDLKTQDDKYCFTVSYEYYEKKDSNIEIHVRTFRRYIKTLQEYSNFNNAILNYKQEGIKIRYQKNFSDFVKAHKSYIY